MCAPVPASPRPFMRPGPKAARRTRPEQSWQLAKPTFGPDKGKLLKQGGIAAALGTLLTPVAAMLAFVDPGLAKDQDCSQLLAQAHAHAKSMAPAATRTRRWESMCFRATACT